MEQVGHVIAGTRRSSVDGATFDSVDPWTRAPWASVARGGAPDVEAALDAARAAADDGPWPRLPHAERAGLLHRWADAVRDNADALAERDTRDMGQPISTSRASARRAAGAIRAAADHAAQRTAEAYPMAGHHAYTRHEPAGVVAVVSPWNMPLTLAVHRVAPALAWGNAVVLKPAEQSPASAELLALLATQAGLPDGVLNVVQGFGARSAGELLVSSPRVDRVAFTGESATGARVAAAAAANLVPVSAECGGKGAALVFADAILDEAVRDCAGGVFANSGQVCHSTGRIYVQRPVYEEFLAGLVAQAEKLSLGDPMDPSVDLGPLAGAEHFRKVRGYLDSIPADGGTVMTGGRSDVDGWFVAPTVAVGLPPDARVCREEVFGPVAVVTPFDTDDEAVALANDTRYGLSARLFTGNLRRGHGVAHRLRAGVVWVDTPGGRDPRAPFGGYGLSGLGREGGDWSRDFYTEAKAVVIGLEGA